MLLFDEYGSLHYEIRDKLLKLASINNWPLSCDAVGMYHADKFASKTKSNYRTTTYFR